jgi:hypothetical protein
MAHRHTALIFALTLCPAIANAAPIETITAQTIDAGLVTCIPNAGTSCIDPAATTGQWRVLNLLGPGTSGFTDSANFLNATLTFSHSGGSLVSTWPTISPLFVETDPFPVSLISQMTSLSFQATLSQTMFHYSQSGDVFVADTAALFATTSSFPPPLPINVTGNNIHPVPEPSSLLLIGSGVAGLLRYRKRRG